MSRIDELRLMTRVARLYHEQGRRQAEIAEQIGLSQPRVSRLLKRAERESIVRTVVTAPVGVFTDLEDRLQQAFGLREAVVADCPAAREDEILRGIGSAAAHYLETTLNDGDVLGISSWSATLLAMVDALQPLSRLRGVRVVQILGGIGNPAAEVHASHLTKRLAELVRGRAAFLPAAGVVSSAAVRRDWLKDPFVREAIAMFSDVTVALVGIGAVEPSRLLASSGNIFSPAELEKLKALGAVGDICLRFFDGAGQPVKSPYDKRVIGMSLEQIRRTGRAVGIAGGRRKVPAIRAALRGGLINVLITDHFTAGQILAGQKARNRATGRQARAAG